MSQFTRVLILSLAITADAFISIACGIAFNVATGFALAGIVSLIALSALCIVIMTSKSDRSNQDESNQS